MRELRLLERIRKMEESPDLRVSDDPNMVMNSILGHLNRILNTKQGSAEIDVDFGIPDFTDLPGSFSLDSIPELERVIKGIIQKYEPRLEDVKVNFAPKQEDVLSLKFSISAKVVNDDKSAPVLFETIVDSDGKVRVKA